MRRHHRLSTVLLAFLAMAPVLAAGRAACCMPAPMVKSHACCLKSGGAQAMAPQGCCKAPAAPKTESRRDGGAIVLSQAPVAGGVFSASPIALPSVAIVRLGRHAHHAEAPDDSPPDRLSLSCILLI